MANSSLAIATNIAKSSKSIVQVNHQQRAGNDALDQLH
jgi:hypothetical protein